MPSVHPVTHAGSLSTLSSLREGYLPLPDGCPGPVIEDGQSDKQRSSASQKEPPPQGLKSCISAFLHFLHCILLALLHPICVRRPETVDSEILLTVEYKKNEGTQEQTCHIVSEPSVKMHMHKVTCRSSAVGSEDEVKSEQNIAKCCIRTSVPVHTESCSLEAVHQILHSQSRGKLLAMKGKDQLSATKECVSESRRQLQEMKADIMNIRDNINVARQLFSQVERGIQDCKWEAANHDTISSITYSGEINIRASPCAFTSLQQMYCDHRIFVEEMKYHFKWNHGVLL